MSVSKIKHTPHYPTLSVALELLKPITWFPPMWAFACGVVSSGVPILENLDRVLLGVLLAGPIVCGMSQAANDWCDRHVDLINEPDRPIPSGRMPGLWGLWIAIVMSVAALGLAWHLGTWGFYATVFAVAAAWAYSAEPVRLKRSGWLGPGLVGLCYEGIPWFTGAAILVTGLPDPKIILCAALYAIGAHGIMTLNDFKALEGDTQLGIKSLPVQLGPRRAARFACWIMALPQIVILGAMISWGLMFHAALIGALVIGQILAMQKLLKDPEKYAPWYNATGVSMFVFGMMICAVGLRGLAAL